ncbi:hypothetical protein MON38_06275 [Hymenobacter sp. DH14]|uniref:Uncharacterized protein n=1 Tax=Hymenobacter cyanobacteriorum TaxID=2926463 RepID=A0A9X1VEA7_9BACT|nr:hypothetical protein [Hymenobacter cyanobacteriorum]MCI1187018.1 hypothetical protein [Hymenobacter cyanobacteriorum]
MKILLLPLALLLGYAAPKPPRIQLKGYFSCQSSLIASTGDALTCYARTQRECRNGEVVLAFEKRLGKRDAKAVFGIVDTIHVRTATPGRYLTITSCTTAGGQPRQYFVLFRSDAASKEYLGSIIRVWGVNAQNQLVTVPVKNIKCLNDDYGAD